MSDSSLSATPAASILLLLSLLPLIGWLGAATWIDCTRRRIPNTLTLTLLAAGLVRAGFLDAMGPALVGMLIGLLLILPFFVLGAMGGGDAKLMAALGCWVLPAGILDIFGTAAILATGYVVWRSWRLGRVRQLGRNAGLLLLSMVQLRRLGRDQLLVNGRTFRTIDTRLPYAVPVSLASLLVVGRAGLGSIL